MNFRLPRQLALASIMLFAACGTDETGRLVDTEPQCDPGYVYSKVQDLCVYIETDNNANSSTPTPNSNAGQWADTDTDGVIDTVDNCPNAYNPQQQDADGDTVGDACDNCQLTANVDQVDADQNGIGDLCQNEDFYDTGRDTDNDGRPDVTDNCVNTPNPNQLDLDLDGVGDKCDNCPLEANPGQQDADNDGTGDRCESDRTGEICLSETFTADVSTIEPSIYVMLDASGSMADELDSTRPRPWPIDHAKTAIYDVADNLHSTARIGLGQFPFQTMPGSTCTVESWLDVALNPAASIKSAVDRIDAVGNTPTGFALNQILDRGYLDDPTDSLNSRRPKAVILVTDGDPTVACNSGSPDNRRVVAQPEAVDAASRLSAAGIPVYVVGFISGAEPSNLNAIAQAGGTDAPGPERFYTADDPAQLTTAIEAITQRTVSCTYQVSHVPQDMDRVWVEINGNTISESATNGFTFDRFAGFVTLNGSACDQVRDSANPAAIQIKVEITCVEPEDACQPQTEVCDYVDNDCDGDIDEGCDTCRPEVCDGVDNDCDDQVDEGCAACDWVGDSCESNADCCVGTCNASGICEAECRPAEVACVENSDCCSGICSGSVGSPGVCLAQ